eukprot:Sspe_Gene.67718::Locus_39960_Transcript_2_2_Confidence_0.667_Length_2313::g.67718::m.67718
MQVHLPMMRGNGAHQGGGVYIPQSSLAMMPAPNPVRGNSAGGGITIPPSTAVSPFHDVQQVHSDDDDTTFRHAPPADSCRPCSHNDWDDVRTRKGAKILRCRTCQGKWKLPSAKVPRCTPFLSGHCEKGASCPMAHVHKKKSNLVERFEKFGDSVLRGVPAETWQKAKDAPQCGGKGNPGSFNSLTSSMTIPVGSSPAVGSRLGDGVSSPVSPHQMQVSPTVGVQHYQQYVDPSHQSMPSYMQPYYPQAVDGQYSMMQGVNQMPHPTATPQPQSSQSGVDSMSNSPPPPSSQAYRSVSPQNMGMRRLSSHASGVPSLLSTDTVDAYPPSPTGIQARQSLMRHPSQQQPVSASSPTTDTARLNSPSSVPGAPSSPPVKDAQQHTTARASLQTKRKFAPPAVDVPHDNIVPQVNPRSPEGAAWQAMKYPSVSGDMHRNFSHEMGQSITDSQIMLPSGILSPADSMLANGQDQRTQGPPASPMLRGVPKVDSLWTEGGPPSSTTPTTQSRRTWHARMATDGKPFSPPSVRSLGSEASSLPTSPVNHQHPKHRLPTHANNNGNPSKENEGVHAMTEDELDAHLEKLGLSPKNSPKHSNRPTGLPQQHMQSSHPPIASSAPPSHPDS